MSVPHASDVARNGKGSSRVAIVQIPKEQVLEFVKGDIDVVQRASIELPEKIDPHRDAAILEKFGIDASELHGQFNGISNRQQAGY